MALLEECDDAVLILPRKEGRTGVPDWYRIRSERGDPNIGATGVICSDDGKGCTDPAGKIARYLQENEIHNVRWEVVIPQSCENHNSSRSNRLQTVQGGKNAACETDVGIKEEGVK